MCLRYGPGFWLIKCQSGKKVQVIKQLYQGYQAKYIKEYLPDLGKIHPAKIAVIGISILQFLDRTQIYFYGSITI
jgi:hypothetical protein